MLGSELECPKTNDRLQVVAVFVAHNVMAAAIIRMVWVLLVQRDVNRKLQLQRDVSSFGRQYAQIDVCNHASARVS